jgi:ATP-dependent DNA helicase RecQ
MYGEEILEVFRRFAKGERASKEWHARPANPSLETKELLEKGHSFEEIAQIRGRKVSSVVVMVADLIEKGETDFKAQWVDAAKYREIQEASKQEGMEWLKPIRDALPEEISYDEIRLVVADLRCKNANSKKAAG